MGKIVSTIFISLDGVVESPDQWHFPYFNDEMGQIIGSGMATTGAFLMGRKLYDEWSEYWPPNDGDEEFGSFINSIPKYVVSNSWPSRPGTTPRCCPGTRRLSGCAGSRTRRTATSRCPAAPPGRGCSPRGCSTSCDCWSPDRGRPRPAAVRRADPAAPPRRLRHAEQRRTQPDLRAGSEPADGVTPGAYASGPGWRWSGAIERASRPVAARRFGAAVTLGP